jgi:PAS domain S-box-containing protein
MNLVQFDPPAPDTTISRILIADDEPMIREEYRCVLGGDTTDAGTDHTAMLDLEAELFGSARGNNNQARYDLCLCEQGDEAVEAVEQAVGEGRPFAVAFLDVRMPPGIDGVTAAERMRKIDPQMNIVFVTGYSDVAPEDIAKRVERPETLLFCQKPLHASELRQLAYALSSKWLLDRELRATYTRLRQLMDSAPVVIYSATPDADHSLTYVSENVQRLFGYAPDYFVGCKDFWNERIHHDDLTEVIEQLDRARLDDSTGVCEYRFKHCDGSFRWVSDRMRIVRDDSGRPQELVGCWLDITDRRHAEDRIIDLAYFDALTGLPNRVSMKGALERAILEAHKRNSQVALLFLDLDHFKHINDTLGHDKGDLLLKEVANRLLGCIRKSDFLFRHRDIDKFLEQVSNEGVMRLGGDEFVVLLSGTNGREGAALVVRRIAKIFDAPFLLGSDEVNVTTSIGICLYPDDAANIDALLKNADMAMYHAKEKGRNQSEFYSKEMNERAVRRFSIGTSLRRALERDELELFYQPKVDLEKQKSTGMEALLRWRRPGEGLVSPMEFIPIAEENGLILPIGEWVLWEACRWTAAWAQAESSPLAVSVNLSVVQLRQKRLADMIAKILTDTGLDPNLLELELTESVLMEDARLSSSILTQLRDIGVRVAVDDFGTGYSSLSYLKGFPLNTLKIDTSFTRSLPSNEHDATIVSATISLAHKLRLKVVAEGVEKQDQLDFLMAHGCEEAQGYFFSPPLPADEFKQWMDDPESHSRIVKTVSHALATI